jgi:hypothetical protein
VGDTIEVRVPLPVRMVDGTPVPGFTGLRLERVVRELGPEGAPRPVGRQEFDGAAIAAELQAGGAPEASPPPPGAVFLHSEPVSLARPAGTPAAVSYAARFQVRRKWSPPTAPITLVVDAAPPPPAGFSLEATGAGARLAWEPPPEQERGTAVYRTRPGRPFPFQPMTVVPATEGNFLDPTVVMGPGEIYLYEIRTARGEGVRSRQSAAAGPLSVDMTDRFPPAAPRSLTALARPGGVDLFWLPNDEADLAGYRVYRREGSAGDWQPLTPEGHVETTWSDQEARPGIAYGYAVSAVDGAVPANESPLSNPQEITVPRPPPPAPEAGE